MGRATTSKIMRYSVLISYILMVVANGLANAIPINGQTTGGISDKYGNLFAPAGYTFAIWGLIYFLLAVYSIYQLPFWKRKSEGKRLDTIGLYFTISSLANALWILAWHYERLGISIILMIGILLCLIRINTLTWGTSFATKEKFFIRLPFSVYFGWITVAMIANVTTWLVSIGWNGFGISEVIWTIVILLVGTAISSATMLRNHDIAYGLVVLWAYVGILYKQNASSGFSGAYPAVSATVIGCVLLLTALTLYLVSKQKTSRYV